jgi:hypothetical protein
MVEYLYTSILAEGWSRDSIPKYTLRAILMEQRYPQEVVDHILRLYLTEGPSKDEDNPALNLHKLSRTLAIQILRSKAVRQIFIVIFSIKRESSTSTCNLSS